ncbi:hypothetical protein [Fangia hongkongensis]|uniref:hypothetical protein n=1 Tax=Fangia hongkongensis TaxID=270495 RepID=UPI00036AB31F|nr:hypothetical protein [Fangia hongkongensis]MBK2124586.1 hypothetical protein [Fangia hongkongensis]
MKKLLGILLTGVLFVSVGFAANDQFNARMPEHVVKTSTSSIVTNAVASNGARVYVQM